MQDSAGPHFVRAGERDGTNFSYQGADGDSWSSSAYTSATDAYSLYLRGVNNTVDPALNVYKYKGRTLRCLGNTTGEFQSLYNQYPTYDQMRKYPVGIVLGGYYSLGGGALNYQGTHGFYWSSSAYTDAASAYRLYLYGTSSAIDPASDSSRRNGFTLRCLAQ